jgi:molybdopterin biosynthesis enzyme
MSGFPLRDKFAKELVTGERIYSTIGRHEFKAVKIQEQDGISKIFPIKTGSEAISTIFQSDGYIEINELESVIEKGEIRKLFFF